MIGPPEGQSTYLQDSDSLHSCRASFDLLRSPTVPKTSYDRPAIYETDCKPTFPIYPPHVSSFLHVHPFQTGLALQILA